MNKMKKPTDSAGATPRSEPPLNTKLVEEQAQQSECQAKNSQELVIANLSKLSDGLSAFQRCLTDVEQHIDAVRTSIDSAVLLLLTPPPHTANTTPPPVTLPTLDPEPDPSCESDASEDEEEEEEEEEEGEDDDDDDEEEEEEEEEDEEEEEELKPSSRSELEFLCETMKIVDLKRYIITHISDIDGLREQVPKALKLSPNPATLVWKCINKGSRKRVDSLKGKASLLALECLLLTMGEGRVVKIEKWVKEEAEQAASAWRARMLSQGGVSKAHEMDARGLLLLIGCFGIPLGFLDRDIRYLIQVSGASKISGALRRSSALMERIPRILEWMLKNYLVVGAIDIAYTFGMEDKFNPRSILTSFLHNSEVSYLNNTKGLEQQSIAVCAGKKKHLSDLKSVEECLECHKIDPLKLLPGWQIDVRIMNLEKDITDLIKHIGEKEHAELTRHTVDQKMAQKRKIDEAESSGSFSNKEMKPSHFPNPNPWPLQQHRVVNHVYDSNNTLLEHGGTAGHIYGYSQSPTVLHGAVAGSIHQNVVGSLTGPVGGVLAMDGAGAGAGTSVNGGSCVGVHGGTLVDHTNGLIGSYTGQLYGPHGDAAVHDRLASHTYAYRPSSYLEASGSLGLPNTMPGDAYRPPPYLEGTTGLPNTIPAPYQFTETIPATELYQSNGSRAVDAVPSAALAHPSSSLYWKR
ncbi:protein FRIGIDA-like [Solanum dulcamara]|uniref:protein FRIGIDA-like n=1 Tax=Solanum dulcamara TaxID=45834 RepID=UPI002486C76A|nr:protein FRIGIDA-like [Solanum dulcamara]